MVNQKTTWKQTLKGWLYVLPMLIIVSIFSLYPIISSLAMSFYTQYNFFTNQVMALGFDNFKYLWEDPLFHSAVSNTLIFVIGVVPLEIVISLTVAVLLNQIKVLAGFFRTIYFLPFVTSIVAISMVWKWIYNKDAGLLNYFLSFVGIHSIDWLNDPNWALPALIILAIWKSLGFNIMLFLVALNNVDKRLYSAATLDGASVWQRFWHITVPMISPMTFLITINAVIGSFKVFDEIFSLFGGQAGPGNAAMSVVFYLYRMFYEQNKYGIAAAAGVVLFFMILIVTLLQMWFSKKHVHY
ncbi:sugar ABC transporter permease [Leuconostoc gelidum subsp. gelidum]|uniref:Sugar ABC transporter permease n=1 Tax=Leuconostoc gelidum subsp. gelidum TaxID=1607839 RepID=A0AB35G0L0_LEUGE|nr:sugar ABC transporter permease [Leuconostoc gelidum]MBZ5963625.1 sugar ABC transporter permease [Leuconostoc gelidum subsp. gelidum]MBZ5975532.1 sugar ABC transporter permease [Leuconostoc gelidum subsp. gelidum]MBZ5976299.1 sugar ABC transporter permease [Leuconostoc gelidum subsp. gelidum]MBZ5987082.1 sugar ABC transporter permease [Leuconostoc gelidum subsp. gelidum]MBZ6000279.1 sugar ABC transporter permease [Leuconostoc gelidum subsp. gelidum]